MTKPALNRLQQQLVDAGLVDYDEVWGVVCAKTEQAKRTNREVRVIQRREKCTREEAFGILREQRRKQKRCMRRNGQ